MNTATATAPPPPALPANLTIPQTLIGDLRSDHAGETGAVRIYQGILAASRDARVRDFAERHLATEREHLALVSTIFPRRLHSRLLPIWHVAGFLTGWLPALFGARAVFATIQAVETFVDHHYQEQVDKIDAMLAGSATDANERRDLQSLRDLITYCQADEIHHRDEANALAGPKRSFLLRAWCGLVGTGSAQAVVLAKAI
ncbi:MAG: demethoxyubiquinone hydroxylase family protein [Pseudomonadota bacterium]